MHVNCETLISLYLIFVSVEGKTRIIRGCGYITDAKRDNKECFIRTGTKEIHVTYCSCTKSYCNTSLPIYFTSSRSLLLFMLIVTLSIFRIGQMA